MSITVKSTLVVGIDFGTTYSGVSWLVYKAGIPVGHPEMISHWKTCPDNRQGNSDRKKVPSKIYYNEDGEISWGFKVPADVDAIEWFKLLLLGDEYLDKHFRDSSRLTAARQTIQRLGKTAVEVVGDFLKALWDYTLQQIYDAKGKAFIDGMPMRIVFTVPSIWTEETIARVHTATELAGMLAPRPAGRTRFFRLTEPEAAAIATLPELEGRADLNLGDSFVIVDIGGGTVDMISYKVHDTQPLSISECVEGDGALCGGALLDHEFEDFLRITVGDLSWNKMNKSDIRRLMNNEWEHGIKQAFDGTPDYYTLEFPSRVMISSLQFSTNELQLVFDKVVSQILPLVQKQIDDIESKTGKLPKHVILVGGFGRSPYVQKYLQGKIDEKITVLQSRGDSPWTAICRGAVLSGAAPLRSDLAPQLVKSRIARFSYGLAYGEAFIEGYHNEQDKRWHPLARKYMANDQIQWLVKKGQDLSCESSTTYSYSRHMDLDSRLDDNTHTVAIYVSHAADLPSSAQGDCFAAFELAVEIPDLNDRYKLVNTGGRVRLEWEFDYKVTVSSSALELVLIADGETFVFQKINLGLYERNT